MKQIKIGTRGSKLALVQANLAAEAFQKLGYDTQLVVVHTRGDANLNASLSEIGRGAFTDVFAQMLAEGKLDVAVHSAKDLPTAPDRDGFACLPRADARDVLVSLPGKELRRIGTGSPRREAAIRKLYPKAQVLPIRGNVDTRIRKMKEGEYDALVLAMAGLKRLHFQDNTVALTPLSVADCVPAACQGIIAIEGKLGLEINHPATAQAAQIERECQRLLEGGCTGGVGCYFDGTTLFAQKEGWTAHVRYQGEESILELVKKHKGVAG